MRTRLRPRASCPNKPQNKNPAFWQSESGRSACRKSSRAAGAHSNRKQRWNRCFHKIRGHVPRILYKPLASVLIQLPHGGRKRIVAYGLPVRRAQTAEYSIESVVSIERLFEKHSFSTAPTPLSGNRKAGFFKREGAQSQKRSASASASASACRRMASGSLPWMSSPSAASTSKRARVSSLQMDCR